MALRGSQIIFLAVTSLAFRSRASLLSAECQDAWAGMTNDDNYQHWRHQSIQFCYLRYQNRLAIGESSPVLCDHWEYETFCSSHISGRVCRLDNGFVRIVTCVPSACSDDALSGIVSQYFNASGNYLDCTVSVSARTPVIAALVSTILILSITAFLVFILRPPRAVRDTAKLSRAHTHLVTISEDGSSSELK